MNLPNKITLTRIFMIPVFVLFFYLEAVPYHYVVAAAIFLIAAATDFLDGYIARSRNLVTNMGKFLDPIADKVLVATAFIVMLTRPALFDAQGVWCIIFTGICVALILARELIVSGFRIIAADRRVVLAADKLGKYKTATQDFAIAVLLVGMQLIDLESAVAYAAYPCYIGLALLAIATLLTVLSGVNYIVKNRQVLKDETGEISEIRCNNTF
ncbi:MAG: CDP-diacylglycerol--glycerol-3-phosphate 3-phosphatidyltransferase [Clostridia bacterium]|nr:CDP-diacylglycerol--glycerol-3-phosphate 3-phosphatidyltransferase [Clostridia bacterium]